MLTFCRVTNTEEQPHNDPTARHMGVKHTLKRMNE